MDQRRTNIVLGTEEASFRTDYSDAFGGAAPPVDDAKRERERSKAVMNGAYRVSANNGP